MLCDSLRAGMMTVTSGGAVAGESLSSAIEREFLSRKYVMSGGAIQGVDHKSAVTTSFTWMKMADKISLRVRALTSVK